MYSHVLVARHPTMPHVVSRSQPRAASSSTKHAPGGMNEPKQTRNAQRIAQKPPLQSQPDGFFQFDGVTGCEDIPGLPVGVIGGLVGVRG